MSEWSHLPNAKHIDRVLASVKTYPEIWDAAYDTAWGRARREGAAWSTAWDTAYDAAWDATWAVTRRPVQAARDAIVALMAYDVCAKYLTMPSEKFKTWAFLSEDQAAILLLPAVIAYEQIRELETT